MEQLIKCDTFSRWTTKKISLVVGSLLFVSLRTNRDSPLISSAVKTARRGVMQILFPKLKLGANYFISSVLRLKPQGEREMQILFSKLKLGANYFISSARYSLAAGANLTRCHNRMLLPLHIEH